MNTQIRGLPKVLLASIFITLVVTQHSFSAEKVKRTNLFEALKQPSNSAHTQIPGQLRHRYVNLNATTLDSQLATGSLNLNFFPDAEFSVNVHQTELRRDGRMIFHGSLADELQSNVILIVRQQEMSALVISPTRGSFAVSPLDTGGHIARHINQNQLPTCGINEDHLIAANNNKGGIAGSTTCEGDSYPVDVITFYTPNARSAAGGTSAIENWAILAIELSNLAYFESEIDLRVRLVYLAETSYPETSDYSGHLAFLRNQGDGVMDDAHTLRDQYGADMVALLVNDNQYCGVAYLMATPTTEFDGSAFSVTSWFCISGNTFAHELGHNMGSHHDAAAAGGGVGAYPFSYGWHFAGASGTLWRTVMAYAPGARTPRFSNPAVLYDLAPTGSPSANNALSINLNGEFVSNFRCTVPVCPQPTILYSDQPAISDEFGKAVDISRDLAIVGEHRDGDNNFGAAIIFQRDQNNDWAFLARLTALDPAIDSRFGASVSIHSPTNGPATAIVGAPFASDLGAGEIAGVTPLTGAAYVFQQNQSVPSSWTQNAKLIGGDSAQGDQFGAAVAITGDDNAAAFAIVGAPFNNNAANDAGAAYIFQLVDPLTNQWSEIQQLAPADAAGGDHFGSSVSIHRDPNGTSAAIVGSPDDDTPTLNAGSAYIFQQDVGKKGTWDEVAKLTSQTAAASDRLGASVDIRGDWAIVGVTGDDEFQSNLGAAIIFERNMGGANMWGKSAKIINANGLPDDNFGHSVSMTEYTAIVGANLANSVGFDSGLAIVYRRELGGVPGWTPFRVLRPPAPAGLDQFGSAVAIDGDAIVIGAIRDEQIGSTQQVGSATLMTGITDLNANFVADGCDPLPVNDVCTGGIVIGVGAHPFDTFNATTDLPDEPDDCAGGSEQFQGDIWYRFATTCTGTVTVSICNADFDAKLGVYDAGCPLAPGSLVACGDNECGNGPIASFSVQPFDQFRIRIGRVDAPTGSGTLSVQFSNGCLGDIHPSPCGNGVVNVNDLLQLIGEWGSTASSADLNIDQIVNVNDLLLQIGSWGPCP